MASKKVDTVQTAKKTEPAQSKIIIRIQSRDGMKRLELNGNETVQNLLTKVKSEFGLPSNDWKLFHDRTKREQIKSSVSRLATANIKHGDLLYLDSPDGLQSPAGTSSMITDSPMSELPAKVGGRVVEDEVDQHLDKQDGLIQRDRDPNMCGHNKSSKCSHCLPIDPFDETYLNQRDIKHMSFHAYVRKLIGGSHGRSTSMKYPLENIVCHIKPGCTSHPPWPDGLCTKCQPNAVTLGRQRYRHVDNIVFENQLLVNRFLDFWRKSGHQRVGILLGRYEPHLDVPLGIKCIVAAIYEPPQITGDRMVRLLTPLFTTPKDKAEKQIYDEETKEIRQVEELCQQLSLRPVGWIFTDLVADPKEPGAVAHTRHAETYFLTAEECITAAAFQCKYQNATKYAPEGYFGSKFVTVVVSGGADKQVHFSGYQVSNQCEALVRDNCIVPTRDASELAWVRESTPQQYVPDVTFMGKDEYGNDVSKVGRPLPVEYLIVDVPCGVPLEEQYTFFVDAKTKPFPVENRAELGELQTFDSVCLYASQFTKNQFLEMISDFHFLLFLIKNDSINFTLEELKPVFDAVLRKNRVEAFDWSQMNEHWATFVQLMNVHATGGSTTPQSSGFIAPAPVNQASQNRDMDGAAGGAQGNYPCQNCTYLNATPQGDCVLCGLPIS